LQLGSHQPTPTCMYSTRKPWMAHEVASTLLLGYTLRALSLLLRAVMRVGRPWCANRCAVLDTAGMSTMPPAAVATLSAPSIQDLA
jgi:hypothetical protein